MARQPRKSLKGHYFHLMTKGLEFIFKNDKNKKLYLKYFYENINWENTTVLAYVVMENHFHMLVHTKSILDLIPTMRRVNTRFANYYNSSRNRKGYVFQDRYVTQPITDRSHLFNCLTYIHKNPVKAKIVEHESEYEFSSYWEYLDEKYLITNEATAIIFGTCDKTKYFNKYLTMHNKDYGYAFFKEDEEIDFTSFIQELKSKNMNEKEMIKLLHFEYKLSVNRLVTLTGFKRTFIRDVIKEGPSNKL